MITETIDSYASQVALTSNLILNHNLRVQSSNLREPKIMSTRRRNPLPGVTKATQDLIVKIYELVDQGQSLESISQSLGISFSSVSDILSRYNRKNLSKIIEYRENETKKSRRKNQPTKLSIRDQDIIYLRSLGESLDSIGERFGISRERIRQICLKSGEIFDLDQIAKKKKKQDLIELRKLIEKEWPRLKLMTFFEAISFLKTDMKSLSACTSVIEKTILRGNEPTHNPSKWSEPLILNVLVEAGTYAFPLTIKSYQNLLDTKAITGPTVATIFKYFGSWLEACVLAGVESGEPARQYGRTYSDTDLLSLVRRFMFEQEDGNWSIEKFEKWRSSREFPVPSVGLLRMRFGSWSAIRVKALSLDLPEYNMWKYARVPLNDN